MTGSEHYPRDLRGYGQQPPNPNWPGDARIAVSIVLNYEEGGESCILHGDSHSESVLTDIGAEALANARNLNVESLFEYGSRVGILGNSDGCFGSAKWRPPFMPSGWPLSAIRRPPWRWPRAD